MIALFVVVLGALVAAVGTGVLAARSTAAPKIYFVAWTVALFGLAIGLGAATLGYLAGYGDVIFRVMELGAQLLAPLSLCLALAETAGRGLPARFAMRLAVSGLAAIAVVILGTDPLNPNATFSTKWADPTLVYQLAPLAVLGVLALFTALTAVVAGVLTLTRASREGLPRDEVRPVLLVAIAALALALPGLSWMVQKGLGFTLPVAARDVFAASCTLAAALIWYAARMAGDRYLGHAEPEPPGGREVDADWDDLDRAYDRQQRSSYRSYETGEFEEFEPADRGWDGHDAGYADDDSGYSGRRRAPDAQFYGEPDSQLGYPGLAALAAEQEEEPDGLGRHRGELDRYGEPGSYDSGVYDGRYGAPGQFGDSGQFGEPGQFGESGQFGEPGQYDRPGQRYDEFSGPYDDDREPYDDPPYADPPGYGPAPSRARAELAGPAGRDDYSVKREDRKS